MKKILAIILTLCLTASLFTSCGFGSKLPESKDQMISFYEDLAAAISEGDDEAYEELIDQIKEYGETQSDLEEDLNELEEDFEEDFKEDMNDLEEDEDFPRSILNTYESAIEIATWYASYTGDIEEAKEIYDYLTEKSKEFFDAAKEPSEARKIAVEIRDEYIDEAYDVEIDASAEYEDRMGEIEDKYDAEIMQAVKLAYSSAYSYKDTPKESRKELACEKDIDDLLDYVEDMNKASEEYEEYDSEY
jgi:hypothetical protein